MRPGLSKEIVRNATAYAAGRAAVDILLVLHWIGTLLLIVLFFAAYRAKQSEFDLLTNSLIVGSAVIWSVLAFALRELAHSVFDLADCALTARQARVAEPQR